MAAITHTPHTTKSPRSARDTSTSLLSARTPCPFALRPAGAYQYSFRPLHPARTIAIAFPCAVAQTFVPLNGPTSFPRNGPRRPTEVGSGNLSSRLGLRCSSAHERKATVGVPMQYWRCTYKTVSCANQGRVLRRLSRGSRSDLGSGVPNRASLRSRQAADAVSNDGRDRAM